MLTITETIDAINKLNTDPDIILGACKRILNPENFFGKQELTHEQIAMEITHKYMNGSIPASDVVRGILNALVVAMASGAIPGHELDLLTGVQKSLASSFGKAAAVMFSIRMKENPDAAKAEILNLLDKLRG